VTVAPFPLHDVDDVPALARKALDTRLNEWGAHLSPHDREDALAFLIATAWELGRSYREDLGLAYSTYCFRMLKLRLVDWYRSTFGDSRYDNGVRPQASVDELERIAVEVELIQDVFVQLGSVALSPNARMTFERIAKPMLEDGLTKEQVADRLGWDRRDVTDLLRQLRVELEELDVYHEEEKEVAR
jgi:hypothetical protein